MGSAADFHARDLGAARAVWWFEVTGPTVVLGSTQADEVVDRGAAERGGVDVTRRRSGGGAVWLAPGEITWVDVTIPRSDPLWDDDLSRAGLWLGEAWVRALEHLGARDLTVHSGAMAVTEWSPLVCFAGLGPGEVTTEEGCKVVGVSQRRTRDWARFQCSVLHRWSPGELLATLALEPETRNRAGEELAFVAQGIDGMIERSVAGRTVVEALVEVLPTTRT